MRQRFKQISLKQYYPVVYFMFVAIDISCLQGIEGDICGYYFCPGKINSQADSYSTAAGSNIGNEGIIIFSC